MSYLSGEIDKISGHLEVEVRGLNPRFVPIGKPFGSDFDNFCRFQSHFPVLQFFRWMILYFALSTAFENVINDFLGRSTIEHIFV